MTKREFTVEQMIDCMGMDWPSPMSDRVAQKLRAGQSLYLIVKSWDEPFFTAWLEAYEKAGQND